MAHSGILSHSVFFMCAAIAYRLCGGKSADYLLKFLFPFPVAIAEGWIGKLVPVVVVEEFHPQRIVVEYFPAVPKDAGYDLYLRSWPVVRVRLESHGIFPSGVKLLLLISFIF